MIYWLIDLLNDRLMKEVLKSETDNWFNGVIEEFIDILIEFGIIL